MENKLPYEYQLLVNWCGFINWDMRVSLSLETFNEYLVMRDWLTKELHEWFDVYEDLSVEVNEQNFMSIWFELDREFDKQSLLDMEEDKEYEIKKRYNGYTMIELKDVDK